MGTLNSKKQKVIHDLTITIIRNQAKVDMLQSKVTDLFVYIDELQNIKGFKKFFFVYFLETPDKIAKAVKETTGKAGKPKMPKHVLKINNWLYVTCDKYGWMIMQYGVPLVRFNTTKKENKK